MRDIYINGILIFLFVFTTTEINYTLHVLHYLRFEKSDIQIMRV